MSHITLRGKQSGYTQVSNSFIDEHMLSANEAQIKIYLYLLRCMGDNIPVSVSDIADRFNYMEKDILRALIYWDKTGLLSVEYDNEKNIVGICLNECVVNASPNSGTTVNTSSDSVPENNGASVLANQISEGVIESSDSTRHFYPQSQIQEFCEMDDVRSLIFVTEHYLGKTLSKNDVNTLIYIYDELHFPVDLIEYLIEYCVSNNHKSMRYIEKAALGWANDGIRSIQDAKTNISRYKKVYYDILKLFGISNRNPVDVEIEYMNRWLDTYCFDLDLISEAISRTIMNTGKASYSYADSILNDWHKKNIHHVTDLPDYDKNRKASISNTTGKASAGNNKFKNFNERTTDYNSLAQGLIKNN